MIRRLNNPGVARPLALVVLAVTLVGLLGMGVKTKWLTWTRDCEVNPSCHVLVGESHGAIESSTYYMIEGPRYWLLQRQTVGDVTMTYIHNMNLGAFIVYGSVLLGATSPMPAAVVSAVGFTAGLAYAYLFAERASGSRRFALLFLVLFAGEIYHNTLYGLNLLRAWHWLPLFGVAYYALGIAQRRAVRWSDGLPFVLLLVVALATGYEIYAFVGGTAVWVLLLFGAGWSRRLWCAVGGLCVVPVVLRQIQVMGGIGPRVWATDLFYTAALKTPLLRMLVPLPSPEEIDLWYRDNLIFRGVENSRPVSEALRALIETGRYLQWWNELGPISVATTLIGLVVAVVLVVRAGPGARGLTGPGTPARRARAVLGLFLGLATGFVVFGYHALYYFVVVHQLPLLAAPVCLTVAFVASLLVDAVRGSLVQKVLAVAGLVLVLGERAYQQWANLHGLRLLAHPPAARWGRFDVGPPGGMYGPQGETVLAIAGLVLAVVVVAGVVAFLRSADHSGRDDARFPVSRGALPEVTGSAAVPST